MKKCILSVIAGATAMLFSLVCIANLSVARKQEPKEYEHIDYVSTITEAECYVCGNGGDYTVSACWGEDNVGIVNLNTFELLHLPINRYDDHGELIEEPAGIMLSDGLMNQETETYVHAYIFPDNAYATVDMTGVQYNIDRDSIQSQLCQACLDSINSLWFTTQAPAEYAVVSFEDRTIRPLLNAHTWFLAGNYGIDCEFKTDGEIDILVHYCPNRYLSDDK